MPPFTPATPSLLAFQLGTNQLNTFESFLTNAVTGIQSAGVISGTLNVCYTILLVGFLWELYQSAMNGGDVMGLGRHAIKYMATALVVQAWPAVFTSVNHAFVSSGSWMTTQGGVGNVLDTWMSALKTEFQNEGVIHTWNVVTGDVAGLLDAAIIIVAYLLYPLVSVIFGFFYMLMGSILFVTGPIVIALLPLGATSRIAKSYIENLFIWNAWPLLYGALGLLITAIHVGDMPATLGNQSFLGALNGLEGSVLVGIMSLVYSLAIAVIPFMAKAIVQGEAGAVVGQMLSAATTAVSAGVGAVAGAEAGLAAAKGGSGGGGSSPSSVGQQGGGSQAGQAGSGNRPATQQPSQAASAPTSAGASGGQNSPTAQTASPTPSSNAAAPSSPGTASTGAQGGSPASGSGAGGNAAASTAANTATDVSGKGAASAGAGGSAAQGSPAGPLSPAEQAAQGNLAGAAQEQGILQGMDNPNGPSSEPPQSSVAGSQSASSSSSGSPAGGSSASGGTAGSTSASGSSEASSNSSKSAATSAQNGGSGHSMGTGAGAGAGARSGGGSSSSGAMSRGPNPRFGLSTFAAYHAARMATQSAASAGGAISEGVQAVQSAIKNPGAAAAKVGAAAGAGAGSLVSGVRNAVSTAGRVGNAIGDPADTLGAAIDSVANAARGAKEGVASGAKGATQAFRESYQKSSQPQGGADGSEK